MAKTGDGWLSGEMGVLVGVGEMGGLEGRWVAMLGRRVANW